MFSARTWSVPGPTLVIRPRLVDSGPDLARSSKSHNFGRIREAARPSCGNANSAEWRGTSATCLGTAMRLDAAGAPRAPLGRRHAWLPMSPPSPPPPSPPPPPPPPSPPPPPPPPRLWGRSLASDCCRRHRRRHRRPRQGGRRRGNPSPLGGGGDADGGGGRRLRAVLVVAAMRRGSALAKSEVDVEGPPR